MARAKKTNETWEQNLENIAQQQELYMEQRLFCNKVIEMMKNCAIIM